jgi:hypothetical protein
MGVFIMAMHIYQATFANGETVTRNFARKLTHAYRIEYVVAANASGTPAVKTGFSGTRELAEKAAKLGKRYIVKAVEIVAADDNGEAPRKAQAPKKAKAVKPYSKGEAVNVAHGDKAISGTVDRVGRLYVYIKLPGFKAARKYKLTDSSVSKPAPIDPAPALAIAA